MVGGALDKVCALESGVAEAIIKEMPGGYGMSSAFFFMGTA